MIVLRWSIVVDYTIKAQRAERNTFECIPKLELWFLPGYLPDYSPIETALAKLKEGLRRIPARTHKVFYDAIALLLSTISSGHARGFCIACGYVVLIKASSPTLSLPVA